MRGSTTRVTADRMPFQALGAAPRFPIAVEPHIILDAPLRADEILLLCSDGLADMVDSTVNVIGHVLNAADESIRSVHDLAAKVFSAGTISL